MRTWLQTSIRSKIIVIIVVGVMIVNVCIYAISESFVLNEYVKIERTQVIQNLQQANDAFENKLAQMSIKIKDWAVWDDSYTYAENPATSDFVEVDLAKNNIPTLLDLDVLMYIDAHGEKLYAQVLGSNGDASPDNEMAAGLLAEKKLMASADATSSQNVRGVVSLETPLLVVASPILHTDGSGPAVGTMLFGKTIDDAFVRKMSELTHLSLTGFPYDSLSLPSDVQDAREQFSAGSEQYLVTPISNVSVVGYALLRDLHDNPAYILRVERPRDVYAQGQSTIIWFLLFASAALFIGGLATIVCVDLFVTSRLRRLSVAVNKIDRTSVSGERITVSGNSDDIGQLAASINAMLEELSHAEEKDIALRSADKDMALKLKERLDQMNELNKTLIARELEMSGLKETIHELQKKVEAAGGPHN